jgi:hypothetical protein
MKRIFTLATALIMLSGVSKAAKNNIDANTSATNTTSTENKATPVMVSASTSVSMADLVKENQQLKMALVKVTAEKEGLENKADFQHNMHYTTVGLYEAQLKKKDEDATNQNAFAWMMHNVILNLSNALNSAK